MKKEIKNIEASVRAKLTNKAEDFAKSEMLKKLETFRSDLLKALDRIHTEDFGICADCKNPITSDRLLTRPGERLCFSCESRNI